ncbi:MAG: glycosyltransferase family 2 protein [Cellulomonadaceae bacterium]|nr:glycosyltransferase family 2 protein [Cellulomonadaceae bacterium]
MPEPRSSHPEVAAIVVTYHPDPAALDALIGALAPQVGHLVVVDNGSSTAELGRCRASIEAAGGMLVELGANRGIATAQNIGCQRAVAAGGVTRLLLMDQDSVPAADMVGRLAAALDEGPGPDGLPVAAVGAVATDGRDGEPPFVYASRRWGPRRVELPDTDGARVQAGFLIASGCMIEASALASVGPMADDMFIDHVDLEWCVRARRAGWAVYAVVGATMSHSLGDEPAHLPGRRRSVHVQSTSRNYYMVRNTVRLMRWRGLPLGWRLGYVLYLGKYLAYYSLVAGPRRVRVPLLARGLVDGMLGRTGPMPARR